jgi:hypothetical protein
MTLVCVERTRQRVALAALLSVVLAQVAWAQEMVTVTGVVTTRADGAPVAGAVVTVAGGTPTATTDAAGRYVLSVPRSAVRGDRISLRVTALGLPPKPGRRVAP